ncbi:MAG: SDR family oxidoreductase [Verrucomicrobiae bacterium]|nr:SDR family oxidoreductase [Verrucomicrobiae bacterium]
MTKTFLIAGGTKGIGRACTRILLETGARCHVLSRTLPETDQKLGGAEYHQADLTDPGALGRVIQTLGASGVSLHGMALFQRHRGREGSWEGNLASTLTASRNLIESALPLFPSGGDKSIVILSSIASRFVAEEQDEGYHVAKAGVVGMARYYAFKLGPSGIRVNCVAPGNLLKEESAHFFAQNPALQDLYRSITPLRRMGTADETARVVRFLLSEEASFITGQEIVVDGGAGLHWQESLASRLRLP